MLVTTPTALTPSTGTSQKRERKPAIRVERKGTTTPDIKHIAQHQIHKQIHEKHMHLPHTHTSMHTHTHTYIHTIREFLLQY